MTRILHRCKRKPIPDKRLPKYLKTLFRIPTWAAEQGPQTPLLALQVTVVTPVVAPLDCLGLVVLPEYLVVDQPQKQQGEALGTKAVTKVEAEVPEEEDTMVETYNIERRVE